MRKKEIRVLQTSSQKNKKKKTRINKCKIEEV